MAAMPCTEKERLTHLIQERLTSIAELATKQRDAVGGGAENLVAALDQCIERELGAKERALGALKQHRDEHGC